MKKIYLLLSSICLALASIGCMMGGLIRDSAQPEASSDQSYSEFDAWKNAPGSLIPIDAGKEALALYREVGQVRFTGQDGKGQVVAIRQDYLIELDKVKNARHETMTIQHPTFSSVTENVVQIGGEVYRLEDDMRGGSICRQEATTPQVSASTYVTKALFAISPGKLLEKGVEVNGVLADVYEIRDLNVVTGTVNSVSGKVWIARGKAYFLKAEGSMEGNAQVDSDQVSGSGTFSYEVTFPTALDIQIPALCANSPAEMIPLPPEVRGLEKFETFLTFTSPMSQEAMVSFYQETLQAGGWAVGALSPDVHMPGLSASITTAQGIRVDIEVRIFVMDSQSSRVDITWQTH